MTIDFGNAPLDTPSFQVLGDGSWLFTGATLASVLCNRIRAGSDAAHTVSVVDAGGITLAEGSFTVTDTSAGAPSAGASAPSATTAVPALDACAVLTPAEVGAALGVPIGAGRPASNVDGPPGYPSGTRSCIFWTPDVASHPNVTVRVVALGDSPPDIACNPQIPGLEITAVALGDEGCWISNPGADPNLLLSELRVRKGDMFASVLVFTNESSGTKTEASTELMQLILARI